MSEEQERYLKDNYKNYILGFIFYKYLLEKWLQNEIGRFCDELGIGKPF